MSPEPSFTQALREEGFIQGSDVEGKVNEVKEDVVDKVQEPVNTETKVDSVIEDAKEEAKTSVDDAKAKANESFESIKKDEIVQKEAPDGDNKSLIIIIVVIIILIIIILKLLGVF